MYLNQRALWEPVKIDAVSNSYGDIEYSAGVSIDVRRQEHVEEIRTADGTIHKTNYIYYTDKNVNIDDKLDGNLVVDLYDMRTLGGMRKLRRLKTI